MAFYSWDDHVFKKLLITWEKTLKSLEYNLSW